MKHAPRARASGPGVEVRVRAAGVVSDVAGRGVSLARALPSACGGLADARDIALLKALAIGTIRAWPRLVRVAQLCLDRPLSHNRAELESLLCIGLQQLSGMRIAPHAAVAATVDAARVVRGEAAAGLVNAVLRRYQRERAALEAAAAVDEEVRCLHPRWLLERLREEWPQGWGSIVDAGNAEPPMWVRVNLARTTRDDYARRLEHETGIDTQSCPHAPAALRLTPPCDVEALPGFEDGLVSVQDAAAQLAASLLDLDGEAQARVLDACAAPGGKTAHILECCPQARVTALDIDGERLERTQSNLTRLGLAARLLRADAGGSQDWWDGAAFDRILLDAPCTATGVIRRHPDIKLLRRPGDATALAREQERLLDALWPLLRPGGRLLYVTCSLLRVENAEQVERFLARQADACHVPIAAAWGRALGPGRQILPGEDAMDGFYYSCLEKRIPGHSE